MREFSKLCKEIEDMDPGCYAETLAVTSARVVKGLAGITENGTDAVAVFADIVMCAIAADGKLDESEYLVVKPVLDLAFGRDVSYEDAVKAFKMAGLDKPKEYKDSVDRMVDTIGLVSPELKEDIVTVCLLVCAIDGKVSFREKRFIKQLLE